MRNFIALVLAAVLTGMPVRATEVTMYNLNGEEAVVQSSDVNRMRDEGWFFFDEIYTVVYSEDGRSMNVLKNRLNEWESVGWHENLSEVQTTLYSEDGRSIAVWNAEVEDWLKVGWFKNLDEVQTTLYSEDGRSAAVWNAEVEAWLKVGWFKNLDEVQTTLYKADGEEKTVWNAEVEAYLAAGWLRSKPGPDPNKPMVALTFDDGPGPYTDRILNCLEKYGAKATFYVVGNRLGKYSEQIKREAELGMEIGSHSWSHAQLTGLGAASLSSQITTTSDKILELTGSRPATLRPPYGSHNAAVRNAAGAPIILWSIDTLDWKTRNANSTYNSIMNNVKDGDIILMHDIHEPTAAAVERVVPALIEKGYQLVTVSELGQRCGGLKAGQSYSRIKPQ